ncbi:class I SAM-dependent methyltransferase [Paraburkholderia sediminicola]|uniref:Class I SAM-dependent methyltransferase n=1 Tax=Paraburkholderia rhynchosiae TaxID=487049 RepID=A0ACC7NM75_9BURK
MEQMMSNRLNTRLVKVLGATPAHRCMSFDPIWEAVAEHYFDAVPIYPLQLMAVLSRIEEGARILDVGCGPARQAEHLVKLRCSYVGIDMSESMLRIAVTQTSSDKVKFVRGDATLLPFLDNSFDWSMMLNNTLGIIPSWQRRQDAIAEMVRVSRNGVMFEVLYGDKPFEVESQLFRDKYGQTPPYKSARFTHNYFIEIGKNLELNTQINFVRDSTNYSHYFLATFTGRKSSA